jgi:uncharacterized protein with PIN domain
MKQEHPRVSAYEQADEAYRQMRYSLVKFANAEKEYNDNSARLSPTQKDLLLSRMNFWRERARMFAAVYHVEKDVAHEQLRNLSAKYE